MVLQRLMQRCLGGDWHVTDVRAGEAEADESCGAGEVPEAKGQDREGPARAADGQRHGGKNVIQPKSQIRAPLLQRAIKTGVVRT